VTASTLASFLVTWAILFACAGFVGVVLRGWVRPGWSNRAILRAASWVAFGGAFAIWAYIVTMG
jgi:hypothetical protein